MPINVLHIELTLPRRDGPPGDVSIRAPIGTTLDHVTRELDAPAAPAYWSGPLRLDGSARLGQPGLRNGDGLTLTRPADDAPPGGLLRLHVVAGLDAGSELALTRGSITVGRDAGCELVLHDPDVSRRHATITLSGSGAVVRDLDSTNGTFLGLDRADSTDTVWPPGVLLRLGDALLALRVTPEPPAAVHSRPDGTRLVNRPPRAPVIPVPREIHFPVPRSRALPQRIQWLAALVPAIVGGVLALILHSPQFLAFALLSPVILLGSAASDRIHARRERSHDSGSFARSTRTAQAALADALTAEVALRRTASPDPCRVREVAQIPGARVWERRPTDPDFLRVRLGVGRAESVTRIRRGAETSPGGVLDAVPVEVDLRAGPLGLVTAPGRGRGLARSIIAQLAVFHSPADLAITLLLADPAADDWRWARWLPHIGRVARDDEEREAVVADLLRLLQDRLDERRPVEHGPERWHVLLIDPAGSFAERAALQTILSVGTQVGITAITLDRTEPLLPASCATVARVGGETGTRLAVRHRTGRAVDAVADQVSRTWAESVARALAPLVDAGTDGAARLPDRCRLLELADLDPLDPDEVTRRWRAADGRAQTALGVGADGPLTIDLVRDGPHALIAGTTGSGKSELLQTLIAGLAIGYPPEQVTFVLVDYKGGAAFGPCADLPHTVGLVTDLDPHLTRRALASLDSELRRREQLFAGCAARDLDAYRAARPGASLPRLVLVVDEFATLADELPDFVPGLVGVAQRGRSLGVHLVLATQRPGGVVSPEIRANTSLRVALRVSEPAESSDVIGTDAASRISRHLPGRAYLQLGSQLVALQTARVGGPRPVGGADAVVVAALDDWGRPIGTEAPVGSEPTDLDALVATLRAAAGRRGGPMPHRPWLPPLPSHLPLESLDPDAGPAVGIGRADYPDRQDQPVLDLPVADGGATLFAGSPRTGRTSALTMSALSAARRLSPDDLQIHAIDAAGGGLAAGLAGLPHTGTLTRHTDPDICERLLRRLDEQVNARRAALVEVGASSTGLAQAQGHRLQLTLLLIDGWEAFAAASEEYDGGRSIVRFMDLLRSAPAAGLTIMIAGDRGALATRPASAVGTKYLLRLADRADYGLAALPARAVPEFMPAGRAVRAGDGAEVQLAHVPTPDRDRLALAIGQRWSGPRHRPPLIVRALPTRVPLRPLVASTHDGFVLGVGGDDAAPISVDLFSGAARLLVAGPPRSGRSNLLLSVRDQALARGHTVVVAAPRHSPLASPREGLPMIGPDDPASAAELPVGPRTLLLIDDVDAFSDTPVGGAMEALVRANPDGLAVVAAGRADELALSYRGVASAVRRARCALLLQPAPGDGELVGIRLPHTRAAMPPGRGVLIGEPAWGQACAGGPLPIQVALR